jgi:hypothetical protein
MTIKDYWSKPPTEQQTIMEDAVPKFTTRCIRVYHGRIPECNEGEHTPADPDAKETHCSLCHAPLAMVPILETKEQH